MLLILAPWTAIWDRNAFAQSLPWLSTWMENEFVRGGVSGMGLVTALAGMRDLASLIFGRRPDASDA